MRLISLLLKRELIISNIGCFISFLYELEFLNEVCTSDYPFLFLFLQQVTVASIELIPRHSFSRSLTSQDGRLWNCVRQGSISHYGYSIYDCSSYGPTFGGGHDIYIVDYASSSRSSSANLGWQYGPPSGYSYGGTFSRTFLEGGGNDHFTPDEVETFYETTWKLLHRHSASNLVVN